MNPVEAIPFTIEPEAADLVAELGLRAEFERMVEHARQTIPGLHRLHVAFAPPYDTGPDPGVLIEAYWERREEPSRHDVWEKCSRWKISTFPPDVFRHFTLLLMDENAHGR